MNLALGIATYFIIWWVVLFAVLPWGVRTQQEAGEIVPGSAESAPVAPRLLKKMLITTLVSGLIFGLVYAVMEYRLISLEDIPFFPNFETGR